MINEIQKKNPVVKIKLKKINDFEPVDHNFFFISNLHKNQLFA